MPHRETLSLVMDTALDAVILMGSDGRVRDWNIVAEKIFGWPRDQALGRMLGSLIIPERYRAAHEAGLRRYLSTGTGRVLRQRIEIEALHQSGEEFPVELTISPLVRPGDVEFLAFIRDVSAEKALLRKLERQAEEARVLHRVAVAASEDRSFDEVIALALEAICALMDWPVGHAFLVPEDHGALISHAWHGAVADAPLLVAATDNATLGPGDGLPGRVWRTAASEWIEDITDERFPRSRMGRLEVSSAFALPIVTQGEVAAILEFFSPMRRPRNEEQVLAAETVGAQVGRALERKREASRQALLMKELAHRTKNILAVTSSLVSQTGKSAVSVAGFAADLQGRLSSLAAAQSLLVDAQWGPTSLHSLIEGVVGVHIPGRDAFAVTGPDLVVPPKAALNLSLIFHELATNAVKYGALTQPHGCVEVQVAVLEGEGVVELIWRERGLEDCADSGRRGFGTRLIQSSVRHDLRGSVVRRFEPGGVVYIFRFPAPAQ